MVTDMVVLFEPIQPHIHTPLPPPLRLPWVPVAVWLFLRGVGIYVSAWWDFSSLVNQRYHSNLRQKKKNHSIFLLVSLIFFDKFPIILNYISECSSPVHSCFNTTWVPGPMEDICHSNMALSCDTLSSRGEGDSDSRSTAAPVPGRQRNWGTQEPGESPGDQCQTQKKRSDQKTETAQDRRIVCHLSASCCVNSRQLCGQNRTERESRTEEGTQMGGCMGGRGGKSLSDDLYAHVQTQNTLLWGRQVNY